MSFESKLKELNISLPNATAPVGSYVAAKIIGKLLYISGQISMNEKGELIKEGWKERKSGCKCSSYNRKVERKEKNKRGNKQKKRKVKLYKKKIENLP